MFSLLTSLSGARPHKHPAPSAPSDPAYVQALATANRFLYAWQGGDLANGMVLLSDQVRHAQNADTLERFFSAETDRAFEIRSGHGNHARYGFPVVLVTTKTDSGATGNSSNKSVTRKSSELVLIDAGKNDWVVDKLP
jgi:hypothetical protein